MKSFPFFRNAILAAFLVLSAFEARAAGMLSKEDAAAGWINLFDGETLFGLTSLGDSQWKADGGNLVAETGTGSWIASNARFTDFELYAKIRIAKDQTSGLVIRGGLEGHPSETGGAVVPLTSKGDKWLEIKVTADREKVTAVVDGMEIEGLTCQNARGHVGVQFHTYHKNAKNKVEVAELKLKPLNLKPIFNGKDLSEWNIIPGHKSVFAVVDGAINIKNGNGQIETKGTYKDFCLQLDIYSNGEHLNSGVFYRGPVGVFWKGYESQVRNHWVGEDRTKPVDFGTGGNYGNQPSRKVVSSDREWFKKTVVVDGNHASVWINGFLASDYLDTRAISPEKDGKNGYVTGPGTIHLQGHDPTTDLSFKNIQVLPYPEK